MRLGALHQIAIHHVLPRKKPMLHIVLMEVRGNGEPAEIPPQQAGERGYVPELHLPESPVQSPGVVAGSGSL